MVVLEPSVVVAVVSRVPIGLWVPSLKTCITSSSGPLQPHTWLALPATPQITLAWAFYLFLLMGRLGTPSARQFQNSALGLPAVIQVLTCSSPAWTTAAASSVLSVLSLAERVPY